MTSGLGATMAAVPKSIPDGFPKDLSVAQLDAYVDAIVDEFREKDLTGALDVGAILLNAALGEQARRELLASRRIAFASLGVAALALVVALLTFFE
jgi:hypothetical protein